MAAGAGEPGNQGTKEGDTFTLPRVKHLMVAPEHTSHSDLTQEADWLTQRRQHEGSPLVPDQSRVRAESVRCATITDSGVVQALAPLRPSDVTSWQQLPVIAATSIHLLTLHSGHTRASWH